MINGAGSVALLAFLQAIWKTEPKLSRLVIMSLLILSLGVVSAGFSNWMRYETSRRYEAKTKFRRWWSFASNIVQILPLLCFAIAVCVLGFGALALLSTSKMP